MKCRYSRYSVTGRPIPCGSPRCPSVYCQRKHAEKESIILRRSFASRPPEYCAVLKIDDDEEITDRQMASYLRAFFQRIRDFRKSERAVFEYDARLEFDRYALPHAHLTVIAASGWTDGKWKQLVRGWWAASCRGRPVRVYGGRIRSLEGLARYVTKNLGDRRDVRLPPAEWDGNVCRWKWSSRGFFAKAKAELWKEVRAEWVRRKEALASGVRL